MTIMEFFGCTFIAFGLPFAMFIFTIATDPLRVIVLMASAFFWLLALLLSSILWFAVVPLRDQLAFGLVFSVIFQEALRLVFYILLRKADEGLQKVSQQGQPAPTNGRMVNNKHLMAYVSGFGFGAISGAFSLINVLADMTGPGTIGLFGDSGLFFITSAFLTLCFVLLHTFWGVIAFAAMDQKRYWQVVVVALSHMLVSCLTLLNQHHPPIYPASLVTAYVMLLVMGVWAFITAGGTVRNIKAFITNKTAGGYDVGR